MSKLVSSLKANPKNPRTITEEKLVQLKGALYEFGDLGCFVYNRKLDRWVGGHQRAKIAEKSEIVITRRFEKLTRTGTSAEGYLVYEGERFKYREVRWNKHKDMAANLAANKGAGEWDLPELGNWIRELQEDFTVDLDTTMFDEDERDAFKVEEIEEDDEKDEALPATPKNPVTKRGDVWILGRHRLFCADSGNPDNVRDLLIGAKPDILLTDPPYGISIVGRLGSDKAAVSAKHEVIEGDENTDAAKDAYSLAVAMKIPVMVIWGGNYFSDFLPPSPGWITWDKRLDTTPDNFADCELAWTNSDKPARIYRQLWRGMIKGGESGKRVHPTQKPIGLAKWCLEQYAPEAKIVLDLFGGSGWAIMACEAGKAACYTLEISPAYCDVIVKRWEAESGQKAVLRGTGKHRKNKER